MVLFLQEIKLLQVRPPHRYIAEHCPHTGKSGSGIATLILLQVPILKSVKEQFVVYTQLVADKGMLGYVLNIYIPPTCTQTDTAALDQILAILDCIPPAEPTFILGDFIAHLLGMDSFARMFCPCCALPRQQHPGETFSKGRRLWAVLESSDLLVINGCNH